MAEKAAEEERLRLKKLAAEKAEQQRLAKISAEKAAEEERLRLE